MKKRTAMAGAALPIALALLGVLSLLASNALKTSLVETRLIETLLQADRAFELGELGVAQGLQLARQHPEQLPTLAPLQLPTLTPWEHARVDTQLQPTSRDDHCPLLAPLPGERQHYEIRAHAIVDVHIESTHVQGFYVCRESCAPPCLAAESAPVKTYWTRVNPE